MDILAFCRKRHLAPDGFKIRQIVDWNRKGTDQSKVVLDIVLPDHFPAKYEKSVKKFVDNCLVKSLGKGLNANSFESSISLAKKRKESTHASKNV